VINTAEEMTPAQKYMANHYNKLFVNYCWAGGIANAPRG